MGHRTNKPLLSQQVELQKAGCRREVLVLVDDVILDGRACDQLAHMSMRGRHFNISLCSCAVSYTSLPKNMRRSLDTLLVFSVPMKGDAQILTWEYCQNQDMARFAMNSLEDYQCLVLETCAKKQSLYLWRADLVSTERSPGQICLDESRNEVSDVKVEERPEESHQIQTPSSPNHTESAAVPSSSSEEQSTHNSQHEKS